MTPYWCRVVLVAVVVEVDGPELYAYRTRAKEGKETEGATSAREHENATDTWRKARLQKAWPAPSPSSSVPSKSSKSLESLKSLSPTRLSQKYPTSGNFVPGLAYYLFALCS